MGIWGKSKGKGETMTDEEKLAKIEEMMHPGFWGTFDYRRKAILEVLGSKREVWQQENPFRDYYVKNGPL